MKQNKFLQLACLAAMALGFVSCSQDELIDNGGALPEGKYPLQIATVTITDGQPSTRVTENDDRMGSTWEVGDLIYGEQWRWWTINSIGHRHLLQS